MTRVLFVDHPYHRLTGSSNFCTALLEEHGALVTRHYWEPASGLIELQAALAAADVAVLWQTEVLAPLCAAAGVPAVAIPMYDGVAGRPDEYWALVQSASVASFSLAMHLKLQGLRLTSSHHQYFPMPTREPVQFNDGLRGFLWERRFGEALDWPTVNHHFGPQLRHLHLHQAPDPGMHGSRPPRGGRGLSYSLSTTKWKADRRLYRRALASTNVYFAPRRTEGIGLGFLEAMAQGSCVVAFDEPTHNEYIAHGISGVLLPADMHGWDAGDLFDAAEEMGSEAWSYAAVGHERWLAHGAAGLVEHILDPPEVESELPVLGGATLEGLLGAWNDSEQFEEMLRGAVHGARPGGTGRGTRSAYGVPMQLTPGQGAIGPGSAGQMRLGLAAADVHAPLLLQFRTRAADFEVRITRGGITSRLALNARQSMLSLPAQSSAELLFAWQETPAPLELVDVVAVSEAQDLEGENLLDLHLGEFDAVFAAGGRQSLLAFALESGQTLYSEHATSKVTAGFVTWCLDQLRQGKAQPVEVLRFLGEQSWEAAERPTSTEGLPLTGVYRYVTGLRRQTDPGFAMQYASDDWRSVAWFYLHGAQETGLAEVMSAQEIDFLMEEEDNGVTRLAVLLGRWRSEPPETAMAHGWDVLVSQHPGLAYLWQGDVATGSR